MLVSGLFFLLGAGLQAGAYSLTQLIVGRCILGLGVGALAALACLARRAPVCGRRSVARAPFLSCSARCPPTPCTCRHSRHRCARLHRRGGAVRQPRRPGLPVPGGHAAAGCCRHRLPLPPAAAMLHVPARHNTACIRPLLAQVATTVGILAAQVRGACRGQLNGSVPTSRECCSVSITTLAPLLLATLAARKLGDAVDPRLGLAPEPRPGRDACIHPVPGRPGAARVAVVPHRAVSAATLLRLRGALWRQARLCGRCPSPAPPSLAGASGPRGGPSCSGCAARRRWTPSTPTSWTRRSRRPRSQTCRRGAAAGARLLPRRCACRRPSARLPQPMRHHATACAQSWKNLVARHNLPMFILGTTLAAFQQLTGINVTTLPGGGRARKGAQGGPPHHAARPRRPPARRQSSSTRPSCSTRSPARLPRCSTPS